MLFGRETLRNLASDVLNDFGQFLKIAGKIMDIGPKIGILFFCEYREILASLHWIDNITEVLEVNVVN